jgi:hypothetical protein
MKLRAKVVYEWEYEVDIKNYGPSAITAEDAIQIDLGGAEDDILLFLDGCPNAPTVSIHVVEE